MLKTLLVTPTLVALLLATVARAQIPEPAQEIVDRYTPKPLLKSPNVAGLGKFGDYPVSHYTGLPEISIPIFDVKSGELSVPIVLSYHASGVRPTDVSGWVGTGWAIQTGGQLSRSIRGKADEGDYSSNPLEELPSVCGEEGTGTFYYLQYSARGVTDTDPDIYSYSFPGTSGKFIIPYGSDPFLVPYRPIVVQPISDGYEITDNRGVLYRFGKDSQGNLAREVSTTYYGGIPSAVGVTAWHLMEIIAPNTDDTISFSFQDAGTAIIDDIAHSYTVMDQCDYEDSPCPQNIFSPQTKLVWTSVPQTGVKTIFFDAGKVEFVMGDNRKDANLKSLDRIEIYSKINDTYVLNREVRFIYSYFTYANGEDAKLKLDAVQFKDKSGNVVQEYRFSYWTTSFSWNPGFWNARDKWGYYNGATGNTDMVLTQSIPFQEYVGTPPVSIPIGGAADREVNSSFAKEGVLRRIDFPTGGFTEFDFESNKYFDGGVKLAGGLRVTKITTKSNESSPTIIKRYKYGLGESGYGVANFNPMEFEYSTEQQYYLACHNTTIPSVYYRIRTFHSIGSYTQDSFDSSPVRYPFVTEYIGVPDSARLGRIEYEYTDFNDIDYRVAASPKFYRNSYFWKRGKLASKTVYDSLNRKLSETKITYDVHKGTTNRYVGLGVHEFLAGTNACNTTNCLNEADETVGQQTYQFVKYLQSTGIFLESQIKEFLYDPESTSNFVLKQTDKLYEPEKAQLKQVTVNRSTGDQMVTVNTYSFELPANASSTGTAKGIYILTQKNVIASPIESLTYVLQGSNEGVVSGQLTTFHECPENMDYVVPDRVYIWESALPVTKTAYVPISINSGNNGIDKDTHYKEQIKLVSYDNSGNIQTVAKTDDNSVTYLWGYGNSRPVAQIVNAEKTEVAYSSFESDGKGYWTYTGTPANTLAAKTGEYYYPLAEGSITRQLPAGKYKLEYWAKGTVNVSGGTVTPIRTSPPDNNGWVLYEKEVVMTTTTTLSLSGGTGAYVEELRVYPSDAQMTTYTHNPLNGITSVTDPSNFTTYYEYDAFGRLKFVKDKDGYVQKMNEYNYRFK